MLQYMIDHVHKTKYLGVLLCSDMKTSMDASRQISKFYAQANTLLLNLRFCSDEVKCMLFRSCCTNMYCIVPHYGFTLLHPAYRN